MKVHVYSIDGNPVEEMELPLQFNEEVREEVISRAVIAEQSMKYSLRVRSSLQACRQARSTWE
jgi:ribosomal protein L4